jgi:hypothetical protein
MNFLETCKEVVSAIDVDELAAMPLGESVGKDGNTYSFKRLGHLALAHKEAIYMGAKVTSQSSRATEFELCHAIGLIDAASTTTLELLHFVPSFMGLIVVEDYKAVAALTEDASQGGQKVISPRAVSAEVKELLRQTFGVGPFNTEACLNNVSFDVGGQEKLLDFTPGPIRRPVLKRSRPYLDAVDEALDAIADLTINIPAHSTLGQQLGSITPA